MAAVSDQPEQRRGAKLYTIEYWSAAGAASFSIRSAAQALRKAVTLTSLGYQIAVKDGDGRGVGLAALATAASPGH